MYMFSISKLVLLYRQGKVSSGVVLILSKILSTMNINSLGATIYYKIKWLCSHEPIGIGLRSWFRGLDYHYKYIHLDSQMQ